MEISDARLALDALIDIRIFLERASSCSRDKNFSLAFEEDSIIYIQRAIDNVLCGIDVQIKGFKNRFPELDTSSEMRDLLEILDGGWKDNL